MEGEGIGYLHTYFPKKVTSELEIEDKKNVHPVLVVWEVE